MAAHKNHQKLEYKNMRAVCFWLHENTCYINKIKVSDLDCHHCNHDSTDNRLENLIPLSNEAHKLVTKSKAVFQVPYKEIIELLQLKIDYYKKLL